MRKAIAWMLALAGATPLAAQEVTPAGAYQFEPIPLRAAKSPAGVLNANIIFLADQLDRNSDREAAERPILITHFAALDDAAAKTPLARLLAEQLMHEFKIRGWSVLEPRVMREFSEKDGGEFSLSRDLPRLREALPRGAVMVGSYTSTVDGVLVSARVIEIATGAVVSSAQTRIQKDKFIAALVDKPVPAPMLRVMP